MLITPVLFVLPTALTAHCWRAAGRLVTPRLAVLARQLHLQWMAPAFEVFTSIPQAFVASELSAIQAPSPIRLPTHLPPLHPTYPYLIPHTLLRGLTWWSHLADIISSPCISLPVAALLPASCPRGWDIPTLCYTCAFIQHSATCPYRL